MILLLLLLFLFEISGNDTNEIHSKNILLKPIMISEKFHFEISGNDINEFQL